MSETVIPAGFAAGGAGRQWRSDDTLGVMRAPDLAVLLDRAAAGDVKAAAAVYDLVSVSAYRIVLLVVGDAAVATEVCREAFSQVWRVWSDAPDHAYRSTAQTWLLMTMHRFATDQVRRSHGGVPRGTLEARGPRGPRGALWPGEPAAPRLGA
ncbi:MAG: hypothetical protein M3Y71_15135 [Actinomycetota bacterium]|nr:hypothetical protein [Actinomycetota bacterium]